MTDNNAAESLGGSDIFTGLSAETLTPRGGLRHVLGNVDLPTRMYLSHANKCNLEYEDLGSVKLLLSFPKEN